MHYFLFYFTQPLLPKSCLDYLQQGMTQNGFYVLVDNQGHPYMTYCDLSYEPGSAWTLVMSWQTAKFRDLPYFKTKLFTEDAPINAGSPNWFIYRETLARMKSIRSQSTHWRATCNINKLKAIDFEDYLRGKLKDLDILTWQGGRTCFSIDYVNIRGKAAGTGTTMAFWQVPNKYILHTDSTNTGCEFYYEANPIVDFFGFYGDGLSPKFRCSAEPEATTQWWFGGYLSKERFFQNSSQPVGA